MKHLRQFNENQSVLKQYVLITKSESGDDYTYFIKSDIEPTNEQLMNWLLDNGTDCSDEDEYPGEPRRCFENVVNCVEVPSIEDTQLI